jgi:hypothetical protein
VNELYVLRFPGLYGLGLARSARAAAEAVGIKVVGFDAWDAKAASYETLFAKVKQSGANAVFIAGLLGGNGGQLIRDKVAGLGPNTQTGENGVILIASDAFATQATLDPADAAAGSARNVHHDPGAVRCRTRRRYGRLHRQLRETLRRRPLAGFGRRPNH